MQSQQKSYKNVRFTRTNPSPKRTHILRHQHPVRSANLWSKPAQFHTKGGAMPATDYWLLTTDCCHSPSPPLPSCPRQKQSHRFVPLVPLVDQKRPFRLPPTNFF